MCSGTPTHSCACFTAPPCRATVRARFGRHLRPSQPAPPHRSGSYHFMFGKSQTKACPMCTAWLDGANGVAHHLAQNLDFAVVAAADLPTLRTHAALLESTLPPLHRLETNVNND